MRMGLLFSAAGLLFSGCTTSESQTQTPRIAVGGDSPLTEIFARVSADTGVPANLLATISWNETRFHFVHPEPNSHAFQYGLLGLTEGGPRDLVRGARLAGVTEEAVRTDPEASIRAAAALLREAAVDGDYTPALRTFGGESFARSIQQALTRGVDGRDDAGHRIVIAAHRAPRTPGLATVTQGVSGYPGAEWVPAYSGNYGASTRGVGDVKYIVIHDTEGSYSGSVAWFKDPDANVSAHYILRSSDGHVAQMVDEKDVAWHDKCFNSQSVGIEPEGFPAKPNHWDTETV